jgi:ribose transport system ATP-binding protein
MTDNRHEAPGLSGQPFSDTAEADRPRLQILDVSKSFGAVRALKNVTFEVQPGEIHGLIGENGAGKSTLMAVASGALEPDTGIVRIDGHEVGADPSQSRDLGLAIVRQHPALFPELTVADNLMFALSTEDRRKVKNPVKWARECLNTWDDRPDIEPQARVSTLNPEQKFILEICRAIYQRPKVLVLDEPSEHLGAEGVDRLFSAVRELASGGTGVVYISHRIREIREIAKNVTVLRDGNNMGTYVTEELTEEKIVNLIIGRTLDATFPDKPDPSIFEGRSPNVVVENLSGAGFSDVSLSIRPGEIVGFAGIDDNGQATIARSIAGLERSTGTVKIADRAVNVRSSKSAVANGIVYIPADRHKESIFSELSIRFNSTLRAISHFSKAGFVSGSAEQQASRDALEKYEVKLGTPDDPISSLSGGNQQKVVIAGALLTSPSLLIADQPTQGVDVGAKAEIYRHLREIAEKGTSVLVLSSDNTELAGICDRVHVVSRGQLTSTLENEELSEKHITDAVLRAESRREHVRRKPAVWSRLTDHDLAPLPVLLLLILGLAIYTQFQNANYLSDINVRTVLHFAAILGVVTAAQALTMMRGGIDLSVGALMSMVVVIASFYVVDGVPAGYHVLGWVLILLVCLGTGLFNWVLIDRLGIHPVLATFGTWILLEAVALLLRPSPGGVIASGTYKILSMKFGIIPLALIVAIIAIALLEYWRTRTGSGKRLLAAGSDTITAAKLGISSSRTTLVAYVGCSLLAGLAGILLIGRVGSGDATAGSLYTLQSVAAAVVAGVSLFGGRGSFVAGLFAAILLTQVRTVTTFLQLNDAWQNIFLAIVTVGAVFVYSIVRERRS